MPGPAPGAVEGAEELEEAEEPEEPGAPGELGPRDGPLPDELGLLGLPLLGPPGPPGPLALPLDAPLPLTLDGELCGVLGVLTGLVGVPEGR